MFGFFKKKKEEVSSDMTKDEEQIAKAKEDIEEKEPDSQTEKDRIDVGETEGEKKADEERAEDEGEKAPAWAAAMLSTLEKIAAFVEKQEQEAQDPDEGAAAKMSEAFGNGGGVFQGEEQAEAAKTMTPAEVAKVVNKFM